MVVRSLRERTSLPQAERLAPLSDVRSRSERLAPLSDVRSRSERLAPLSDVRSRSERTTIGGYSAMPANNPVMLQLAPLPRTQIGPFLILGVDKDAPKDVVEAQWVQRLIWARKAQTRSL